MLYCGRLGNEKVYLNFLYSSKNTIHKINKEISNKQIKFRDEYLDKCTKYQIGI